MIKEKQLVDHFQVRGLRWVSQNGEKEVTIQQLVMAMLREGNKVFGLPIDIREETVQTGGIFNSSTSPCIILHNNQMSNYLDYVLIMTPMQGNICHIQIRQTGYSKNMNSNPNSLMGKLTGAQSALQAEMTYYATLEQLISETLRA